MQFLTGLLASIIRPIIQNELNALKKWIANELDKKMGIREEGIKARELKEELANANTNEERRVVREKIFDYFDSVGSHADSL